MKNREKFAKEIMDIACSGHSIAFDKEANKLTKCNNTLCGNCAFHSSISSCRNKCKEWSESEYKEIEVDCVICSIGTSPNPLLRQTTKGLETNPHGCIITKTEGGLTTRDHVYAGGDAVTGAATVILAMGAGKHAAKAIDEEIMGAN